MIRPLPKAFSLIEISIVVLVVSVLIAGITASSKMIAKSKLRAGQVLTKSSKIEQIPGMVLWYEATLPGGVISASNILQPEDGDAVSTWKDFNPTNVNYIASQTTSASQPLYKTNIINGLPALKFDGSNDYFQISNILNNDFTFFIVVKTSNAGLGSSSSFAYQGSGIVWADSSGTGHDDIIPLAIAGGFPKIGATSDALLTSSVAIDDNKPHIVTIKRNRVLGNLWIYVDSASTGSSTGGTTSLLSASSTMFIGCDDGRLRCYDGYIAELIMYNRPLQTTERLVVEKYLSKKWGVPITLS
jgi:prepilin-type N-terminal cleavage/methylation domain-containing protein